MRKTLATFALVAGLALTGCATTETADTGPEGAGEKSGNNAQSSQEAEEALEDTPEPEPEPEDDGPLKFGKAMEWQDGLYVKVSKPSPFNPSQYSRGKFKNHLSFTVKVVNNTGSTFDVSMFNTTMQSGNAEAEEVFDSANGYEGSPMTKLLDGRESQFKIGYSVQNPKDLVLEVSPDWDHEAVIYATQ